MTGIQQKMSQQSTEHPTKATQQPREYELPKQTTQQPREYKQPTQDVLAFFHTLFSKSHSYLQNNLQENYLKMILVQENTEFQLSVPLNEYTRGDVKQGTEQTLNSVHY
jgi:hypothetical protein